MTAAGPKVSVIIPCHNAERHIEEAILSARNQTWRNVEVIVVDDSSTDESLAAALRLESATVKVASQKRAGAAAARNTALGLAEGDFIQYLDADDLLTPNKIEAQLAVLAASDPDLIAVSAAMYFRDGSHPESGRLEEGWPMIDSDDPVEWIIDLWGGNPGRAGMVPCSCWLTPRHLCDRAGLWNPELTVDDDGEYFTRVVLASRGIRRSTCGYSYYRKHAPERLSLSRQFSDQHQRAALRALHARADHLLKRTADKRATTAVIRLYRERAFVAYPFSPEVTKEALDRALKLGDQQGGLPSHFGSAVGRILAQLFGWRLVRWASVQRHRLRGSTIPRF